MLFLPAIHAEEIPIPGTGPIGTPAYVDLPQTCDPVGLVCIGPVHAPAPVGVAIDGEGFVLVVDPDGNPGSTIPPTYHNVTVGSITVPVVLCPNGCTIPATPEGGLVGDLTVELSGPVACAVTLDASPNWSCDPLLECNPLEDCGVPDPEDFCLRGDQPSPECFVPVVGPCDPLQQVLCVLAIIELAWDATEPVRLLVLDVVEDVEGLVPEPNDLCLEGGEFPECIPTPECADDVLSCVPPAPCTDDVLFCVLPANQDDCVGRLLPMYCVPPVARPVVEAVIPTCTPEVMAQPAYVCRRTIDGKERIMISKPLPVGPGPFFL